VLGLSSTYVIYGVWADSSMCMTNGVEQMECAQIEVTGGTGAKQPTTFSIPGIYKANDPGVLIDIYNTNLNSKPYVVPGEWLLPHA
jgi:hypothetical protein